MSDSDVTEGEMDDNWFSDAEAESILSSAPTSDSSDVHRLLGGLRESFATPADVPAGAMLQEFVTVIDLTTTTGTPTGKTRSKKLITGLGTFIATTTGKVVLGTAVAAASVSGAHAADIVDVPLLPDNPPAEVQEELDTVEEDTVEEDTVEETAGEGAPEELPFTNDEEEDDATADDAIADDESHYDDEVAEGEDVDESQDDQDDQDENHGEVVSEFARTTDLEGCEKGQAIAELARSKSDDESEDDHQSKCHKSDDDEDDDEVGNGSKADDGHGDDHDDKSKGKNSNKKADRDDDDD